MGSNRTSKRTGLPRPFLKWAGGKRQFLRRFEPYYPESFATFHEPFVGGGAVFFHLVRLGRITEARLSDVNRDLIATYDVLRDSCDPLVSALRRLDAGHDRDQYYEVRQQYNERKLNRIRRAAAVIYLNRTCFNGLHRVNSRGHFNVPMGKYENPKILDEELLRTCSSALGVATLESMDFRIALEPVAKDDFVYLDPPYVPLSPTANFTAYATGRFDFEDQIRLAEVFRELDQRGAKVMLSNHETPEILDLYSDFAATSVRLDARRAINSRGDRRGPVREILVRNYG